MKKQKLIMGLVAACGFVFTNSVMSGQVGSINSFSSGTVAVAADVNANFTEQTSQINDNDSRVVALEAALASLQSIVTAQAAIISNLQSSQTAIENSNVMDLDAYLTVTSDGRGPIATLSGINVRVVNGVGNTDSVNGLGNVIIGYDEAGSGAIYACDDGLFQDRTSCEANGKLWSNDNKTGSHYLVLGHNNNYTSYAGMVAGRYNYVNNFYSTVSGGTENVSSGEFSSISGGRQGKASGPRSMVSGGYRSTASGGSSSVNGGYNNEASGAFSSVNGGWSNISSGVYSVVLGGHGNTANGDQSSISGGQFNTAIGVNSSVSGGSDRSALNFADWVAGSLFENN